MSRKLVQMLNLGRRSFTSIVTKEPRFSLHSIKGEKSGENQDMAGVATSHNPDFLKDPKTFLGRLITESRQQLSRNPEYKYSGSTLNVTALIGNELYVATLGDSPTVICITGEKGESISVRLSADHKFSDEELLEKFPDVEQDASYTSRCDGLAVPCLGHSRIAGLDEVQPRITSYDLSQMPAMVKLLGIHSPISSVTILSSSDGLYDYQPGERSIISTPITLTHQVQIRKDGKLNFSSLTPNENELSQVISFKKDPAKTATELAQLNESRDDISMSCLTFAPQYLTEANPDEALILFTCDGNGPKGNLASKELSEIICRRLQLQPIPGLPLSFPHNIDPSSTIDAKKSLECKKINETALSQTP